MSLQNEWYIACASNRLQRKPVAVRLFSTDFVIWRDGAGAAHGAVDRCAHRNAPLSEGFVKDDCLVCPYHGWQYDAQGQCQQIPSLAEGRAIPATARVPTRQVRERDGYVWICPGQAPPAEPRAFPHCDEKGWTTFRMRTRFASNVEACLENFLDCPHTATVHRGWFRNPDPREMDAFVRKGADFVEVEFENEPTTDSLISRLFYPKNSRLRHTDRFLMPNISRVDYQFDERRSMMPFLWSN
jgi:phenylpropionate dioxygenase-like ring-hydroxylating dioxygenase large terminal subunit